MARCFYLEYRSGGFFEEGVYRCSLSGQEMGVKDAKIKFTCNPDYGEEYKNCPVYKTTR